MIRMVEAKDRQAVQDFFDMMVRDTWHKEGVDHLQTEMAEEIQSKYQAFEDALEGLQSLYVYEVADQILGIAAISPCSDLVQSLAQELGDLPELSSVMIHKDYQGQGYGSKLVDHVTEGLDIFCLDSGYKGAQKIWCHKYGQPYKIIEDYWSPGYDHYIWLVDRRQHET